MQPGEKIGDKWLRHLAAGMRHLAAGICILALGIAPAIGEETAINCTNLASGSKFQIKIDYDRSTVDSNPARIGVHEISWRDENRWNYTLDRQSGNLTIVLASSTGGSFLYENCKLEN
jgi:hypothetical protein